MSETDTDYSRVLRVLDTIEFTPATRVHQRAYMNPSRCRKALAILVDLGLVERAATSLVKRGRSIVYRRITPQQAG